MLHLTRVKADMAFRPKSLRHPRLKRRANLAVSVKETLLLIARKDWCDRDAWDHVTTTADTHFLDSETP